MASLTQMPLEIKFMIAEQDVLHDQDRAALRHTCRDFGRAGGMYMFRSAVLDFGKNTGKNLYGGPLNHTHTDADWDELFHGVHHIGTYSAPMNRRWTMNQFRNWYSDLRTPYTETDWQPSARADHVIQHPHLYPYLLHNCRKLQICVDRRENATFPSFVYGRAYKPLIWNMRNLQSVELFLDVLCAEDNTLVRMVMLAGNASVVHPRHDLHMHYSGSYYMLQVLRQEKQLHSLGDARHLTSLTVYDFISARWHKSLQLAMQHSRDKLRKLSVYMGGGVQRYTLDDVFTRLHRLEDGTVDNAWTMGPQFDSLKVGDDWLLPQDPAGCRRLGPNCTTVEDENGNIVTLP